uniref:DUF6824 domain-containing protein n=1 Tax=Amphora coffeiformis TaxID=265554 RepID=A0A7S3LEI9_9STRA
MNTMPLTDIRDPGQHDVLSGRGVATNRHEGNVQYRSLVALNKEVYVTSTKKQKMQISRSIVNAVRSLNPPGRFLDKHPETGLWYDIGDRKAIEKTSQTLRDGAAEVRKQLSQDLSDPNFLTAVFDLDDANTATLDNDNTSTTSMTSNCSLKAKSKPVKAKASFKKGHRRTESNPNTRAEKKHAVKHAAIMNNLNFVDYDDLGFEMPELVLSPVNSFLSLHDLPERPASFDCLADLPDPNDSHCFEL